MRILVTGSSGFIGLHLVRALTAQRDTVLGLDRSVAGDRHDGVDHVACDLLNRAGLAKVLTEFQPDAIVHLAARTDLDEKRDLHGYAANIEGVSNLVAAIRETPSVQRCIFTSSQLVCMVGYLPKDDNDYRPNTLYGESKVQAERIVRKGDGGGVEWCLVRPTTVWGPGMSSHYQRFFRMIARGCYFHVGSKPLYKSFGYVGNVVHQYLRLLAAPANEIHHRTFYLADYEPISLPEWANAFQRALGAREIRSCPELVAKLMARGGNFFDALGFSRFPFNSFRLNNLLTEYRFDLTETERICGPLPYTMEQGVTCTTAWLKGLGIGAPRAASPIPRRDAESGDPA